MTKATLTISGDDLLENVIRSLKEFQDDKYAVHYKIDNGWIFMYEQYKKSVSNFVINVILDTHNMSENGDEIRIQCFAMGEKNRTEINLFNVEKSSLKDVRYHMFGFADRNNFTWEISELVFEK